MHRITNDAVHFLLKILSLYAINETQCHHSAKTVYIQPVCVKIVFVKAAIWS